MDCIFCKIASGEIPSLKVYEDDIVLSFLDINPKSNGHTLIIPKKHFNDLDDIDLNTLNHINKISKKIKKILEEKLNCESIQLVQNNGLIQEVKHYHLHLIPYYKNKTKLNDPKEVLKKIKD